MICLLLIMMIIFINGTESAEQKIRHPDTLLKEEDMTAKTKIWLLMVESGKVDQEELRKITPKSIFIAPLLNSRTGKCKDGYRHDHLGQCVKVIKIDPKVQLELLLQRLNQLYSEKKEEKEEEKTKETEVSSGPLHFSLPISNKKTEKENIEIKLEGPHKNFSLTNSMNVQKTEATPEFIPFPLPMMHQNQTLISDIESSGAELLNISEPFETPELEGSGYGQGASGDGFQEESTIASPIIILSEETDYFDTSVTEPATAAETQFTVKPLTQDEAEEFFLSESYPNATDTPSANEISSGISKENVQVQTSTTIKNNSNPDKIIFPSDDGNDDDDDDDDDCNDSVKTFAKSSPLSSRIRFPDDMSQPLTTSYLHNLNSKSSIYQTQSSAVSREQFWWLPKNWQIDDNQQKSPLVKVWSRLPLIHDVSYSHEPSHGFKKSDPAEQSHTQISNAQPKDREILLGLDRQQLPIRIAKPFGSSRFQDILLTQKQHFRLQR